MLKKMFAVIAVLVLTISFGACKKKEEKPQLPAGHPPMEGGMPQGMGMPNMPKVDRKVIVSKEVKATWKAVKIAVEDRKANTKTEYTINVGSEKAIPNTNLKVKVLNFLPDFKMTDKEFVSSSNKPNMPAAQVVVSENGKEIWSNWLFSMQPGIHPFQHDAVGLMLVGGVSK